MSLNDYNRCEKCKFFQLIRNVTPAKDVLVVLTVAYILASGLSDSVVVV